MSFITKRERVFNDYDLLDLPARNEGKLKAYASCTDARAWSHFCSDKSEHLVEIIKRNNETVRPKYLPTKVIVDTLMVAKNAEITRLKQKIEEFEQLIAAYDQLDLSCEQKCEIANAHATIKAANRELDDMVRLIRNDLSTLKYLDLDLSGFTEALDSEAFETGKSRGDGDEATPKTYEIEEKELVVTESKYVQLETPCTCEASTLAKDPRIEEMQDVIICKDAKLNAMKNTIAVMENDVCEPYCIYAHIYTALEKIFGILCQNDKYKQYLNLMTAGKDIRCIDIKGKILFKLKVLERFCTALIAPCNQEFSNSASAYECACYHADVSPCCIETNFAMTSSEARQPNFDNKRAHLVADIIQNEEMKEILSKESFTVRAEVDFSEDGFMSHCEYNIDNENLVRLKKLQENYDDLMICYESLKHEKDCLDVRCRQYEDLEKEFDHLKLQINEYNSLWNEKEHYRKRSADLDSLKEQYLVLTDETACLETQLKAESEINHIKCKAIDDLRNENVLLEKKLNDALIAYEKEKNCLLCKLKEADCRVMCQQQQIKSLSLQIDRFLEQDQHMLNSHDTENNSIALIDEVEAHKDQIKNLKNALFCNEEEKQNLQQQYQDQLQLINDLRVEIEDWKSAYEKTLQRNDYLEKYSESLIEDTKVLSQDAKEKSLAVENLMNVVKNKSQEINKLEHEIVKRKEENTKLLQQIKELQINFDSSVASLETEKTEAQKYLHLARAESQELLNKVKDYDRVIHSNADITKSLEMQIETKKELENLLVNAVHENTTLKMNLASSESNNAILLKEINSLEGQNNEYKTSLELTQKESSQLKLKLKHFDNLTMQLQSLQESHDKLIEEKKQLENKLLEKNYELENAMRSIQLTKRESDELIDKLQQSESIKDELYRLREACQKLADEKYSLQKELMERQNDIEDLLKSLNNLQMQNNEHALQKCEQIELLEQELEDFRKTYEALLNEKNILLDDLNNKKDEFNKLYNNLEENIEENRELVEQIKSLDINAQNRIKSLQDDNLTTQATLNVIKKESAELFDKIKYYETLEVEFHQLKRAHSQMKMEKQKLQDELDMQLADLKKIEKENYELHCQSQNLISNNEDLENALISSRTELIKKSTSSDHSYLDILGEIKELRQEKLTNQKKIRDLLDRLDDSENVIANLSEDVLARNDKITLLENHINDLKDEVRQLHFNLAEVVDTGEQLKDFSIEKIDSLKMLDAHHSKATHNMKMELAKLQHQNATLEDQLSVNKIKSEESARDNNIYESQISNLKMERQIIVSEIKQLELNSVGDSALIANDSNVDNILLSLDRIRKYLDSRISKSTSLEQTILKVQTSSQLLLSKADEAKRIVEKEKQKIMSEKEEAIKDRQHMERQLVDLKEKLEKQIANDKIVIENLEATILNQKLIINKINQSTQEYISKLKEELETIQNLYHNSIEKIGQLQEKLDNVTEDKRNQNIMLEKLKNDFDTKCKEIDELQKQLNDLNNKPVGSIGTQTKIKTIYHDVGTQIDRDILSTDKVAIHYDETNTIRNERKGKKVLDMDNIALLDFKTSSQPKPASEPQIKQEELPINEVQILTANIEPTFDYVKNSYMNYKIRCLSHGRLEQHSFSCLSDNEINETRLTSQSPDTEQNSKDSISESRTLNPNLIDIYNRRSMHTNSSKGNYGSDNIIDEKQIQEKSSAYVEFGTTDTNINGKYINDKTVTESTSHKLAEKDLFVIYKDSQSSYENKEQGKPNWSEVVVEAATVYQKKGRKQSNKNNIDQESVFYNEEEEEVYEENNIKPKLKIKIPRIENESNSMITTSDVDKKSLDSYTMAIYAASKRISTSDTKINDSENGRHIKDSTPSLPTISNEESFSLDRDSKEQSVHREILRTDAGSTSETSKHKKSKKTDKLSRNIDSGSHHKLSRVEANVLLLEKQGLKPLEPSVKPKGRDFGLEYILDTVQGEINPNKNKHISQDIRVTKSDEMFNVVSMKDSKPAPNKTMSYVSKSSDKSNKTFIEQSIMAKLDTNVEYENTINSLTKALENIEKDYKKKIEAIKVQYDTNIKSIINEHNQGVKSIQGLHEDTLQDIIKIHENEVENLRSMSIEAMRKAEKLEKENRVLKSKVNDRGTTCLDEEPMKMTSPDLKRRKKSRSQTKTLTKTTVEAFNVKPKTRVHGPCTCSLDINVSETIRNIFEEVDVEQRKMAEHTYIKYIANKMLSGNVEALDAQELSYLHLKVCRSWKSKLSKEEALQKRIDSLEIELMNKQRNAQQHFAELDRKVAEERRRLQEVREAVCRSSPRARSPAVDVRVPKPPPPTAATEKDSLPACACNAEDGEIELCVRRSAGDLVQSNPSLRSRRTTTNDSGMVIQPRQDMEDRRERRLYNDEPPTRLRRSHDRQARNRK